MFISILINLILSTLVTQSLAVGNFDISQDSPEPIILIGGQSIAGAREEVGPVRVNYQSQGIKLTAKSALVVDRASGKVLLEDNVDEQLSIASISKLVMALVFLDNNPGWDLPVTLINVDQVGGARIRVGTGESVTAKDLFYSSLVGSANNATLALVRATNLSEKDFVVAMNKKVKELGMRDSYFAEPTGLNRVNRSTARDVVQLIKAALESEEIQSALALEQYTFRTANTKRWVQVKNTDKLLKSFLHNSNGYSVSGGKTGYTEEAGYCLGVGITHQGGNEIIVVVLASESDEARFQETKGLVWWTFKNWQWQ